MSGLGSITGRLCGGIAVVTLAAALCGAAVPLPGIAAERASPAAAPSAAATEQELTDTKAISEESAKLRAEVEAAQREYKKWDEVLTSSAAGVQEAGRMVDELVAGLGEIARRFDPNGAYMKQLEQVEAALRELARESVTSANPADRPYAEKLEKLASQAAALQSEARDVAAQLTAQTDRMVRAKAQIKYARAVAEGQRFVETARSYLDAAKGLVSRISSIADKSEALARPTVPTQ